MARIALVDDEATVLTAIANYLEATGHRVSAFQSGEETLEWLNTNSVDIMIIDSKLPGASGTAVAQTVHETVYVSQPATILMSGATDLPETATGVDVVLAKPLDPDALDRAIAGLISAR